MSAHEPEALIDLPHDHFGTLRAFVPDTPWTTSPLHVLERRSGNVCVDSPESPRNLVVRVAADLDNSLPEQAWLFGNTTAQSLRDFVATARRPIEFVCDDDMAVMLEELIPEATWADHSVHWFESLDVNLETERVDGLRRLRLSDVASLEDLRIPGMLRTFESTKDLLMAGGGYGVLVGKRVVSAAVTIDVSVNYARILCATAETHRHNGFAYACCRRLLAAHHDQGRLGCTIVNGRTQEGETLAAKLGFTKSARLRTYTVEPVHAGVG